MEKNTQKVKESAEKLLSMLGITAEVEVEAREESFQIVLQTEESGMLIGYHGETLESLQTIISLVASKEIGEFVRVSIEVGDYKKNRVEYLRHLVSQAKEQALSQNTGISLSDLKSWERREVHMMLADDKEVTTESMGEGRDRVLVVKPRE
ncbi:MAG TPA: KH domain-containing protein [Patescibacteria group bacterium]